MVDEDLASLRVVEVPVRYRRRVGVSKITGTLRGTILAGYKILKTIFAYRIRVPRTNDGAKTPG